MAEPSAPPPSAADLFDKAVSLLTDGRANEALWAASQAVLLRDDTDTRLLFVQCVRSADRLPAVPEFDQLLIRALREA